MTRGLVFLHGVGASSTTWQRQIARFEKIMAEYRMLAATSDLVKTVVGDLEGREDMASLARLREIQTVEPGEGVKVIERMESGDWSP